MAMSRTGGTSSSDYKSRLVSVEITSVSAMHRSFAATYRRARPPTTSKSNYCSGQSLEVSSIQHAAYQEKTCCE